MEDKIEGNPEINEIGNCDSLKLIYDECFNEWYSKKFVTGNEKEIGCEEEFKKYQKCIVKKLIKENPDEDVLKFIKKDVPESVWKDEIKPKAQ